MTEDRRGEGFAFFRWHSLKYGNYGGCCPGYGRHEVGCSTLWDSLQRDKT